MKNLIFIMICLFITNLYSQEKKRKSTPFHTVDLSFSIPNQTRYDSSLLDLNGAYLRDYDIELRKAATYGVTYTYNYPLLNRLYLGVVGGYSNHISPKISNIKLGGILRYKFIDALNPANFYLLVARNISLNEYFKNGSGNIRVGMSFSVLDKKNYNLMLGGFWDYSSGETKKPIIDPNEGKGFIFLKSYGISFGVQF